MIYLAEVAGMDPLMVGTMIGGMLVTLLGGGVLGKKLSDATRVVSVTNNPLKVELQKEFVTRAEHDVYRMEVRADFQRMEGSILRMSDKVETKHLELLATIERAAKTGVDGRVHLWEALKPMDRELAALRATTNVAAQLEKLAVALTNNSQTHGKTTR